MSEYIASKMDTWSSGAGWSSPRTRFIVIALTFSLTFSIDGRGATEAETSAPASTTLNPDHARPALERNAPVEPDYEEAARLAGDEPPAGYGELDDGTPRPGVVSGGDVSIELGWAVVRPATAYNAAVGDGVHLGFRAGIALWDHLALNGGMSHLKLEDMAPFSVQVVDCTYESGQVVGCSDDPHSTRSSISATLANLEAGYQHRFRPRRNVSLLPGLMLGHTFTVEPVSRGIPVCSNCPGETLEDVDFASPYVAPFFRSTFGEKGGFGVSVRSLWFLAGDLAHILVFSVEFVQP